MRWGLMLPLQLSEFNVSNWREQSEPMLCVRGLPLSIYHLHKMVSHYHSYITLCVGLIMVVMRKT